MLCGRIPRICHVRGLRIQRPSGFEGKLLVLFPYFADDIVPPVIPRYLCFSIHDDPGSVASAHAFSGLTIGFQGYKKLPVPDAHF